MKKYRIFCTLASELKFTQALFRSTSKGINPQTENTQKFGRNPRYANPTHTRLFSVILVIYRIFVIFFRLHGSYEALKYGSLLDGLADLTGGITESLQMAELSDADMLRNLLKNTSLVTAHHVAVVSVIFNAVKYVKLVYQRAQIISSHVTPAR